MTQPALKAIVVKDPVDVPNTLSLQLALFNEDGEPWTPEPPEFTGPELVEFQANSEATTVEELVADFNDLLGKLQAAGLMNVPPIV